MKTLYCDICKVKICDDSNKKDMYCIYLTIERYAYTVSNEAPTIKMCKSCYDKVQNFLQDMKA